MFKRASCTPSPLLLGASQAKTARLSHVQPLELVQEENAKFTKYQLIASTDLSMLLIKLAKTFPHCVNPLNNSCNPASKVCAVGQEAGAVIGRDNGVEQSR